MAAEAAGLTRPRVIPLRKITQEVIWRLWHGPDTARTPIEMPVEPDAELVARLLEPFRKVA